MVWLKDIDSLLKLENNWDSYRSPIINPKCVEMAKQIAEKLSGHEWQAIPSCSGGIQLEEHTLNHDIEISIWIDELIKD